MFQEEHKEEELKISANRTRDEFVKELLSVVDNDITEDDKTLISEILDRL